MSDDDPHAELRLWLVQVQELLRRREQLCQLLARRPDDDDRKRDLHKRVSAVDVALSEWRTLSSADVVAMLLHLRAGARRLFDGERERQALAAEHHVAVLLDALRARPEHRPLDLDRALLGEDMELANAVVGALNAVQLATADSAVWFDVVFQGGTSQYAGPLLEHAINAHIEEVAASRAAAAPVTIAGRVLEDIGVVPSYRTLLRWKKKHGAFEPHAPLQIVCRRAAEGGEPCLGRCRREPSCRAE